MLRSPARRARREPAGDGPDLVARTRRLFHLCAVATLLLTVPDPLPGATPASLVVLAVATAGLGISWTCRYRFGRASLVLDGADAVALGLFALTCSQPAVALAVAFTAQWSRALYGRAWHAGSYVAGLSAGMVGAVLLWDDVPWHAGPTPAAPVVIALPVLAVSAVVSRHLAAGLFALDESKRRDAALADLGTKLLGLTDREEIFRRTWAAAGAVSRASAGLVVATFDDDGARLHLRGQVGGTRSLPASVARPDGLGEGTALPAAAELTAVAPEWRGLPIPDQPHGWMLLGGPAVADGVVTLFRALMNQVALALRNADSHRDLAEQARTDPLTGLPNRVAFTAALAGAGDDAAGWVLFIDLDDFKVVNDGLGHHTGDELLRQVARRLTGALRPEDLCARLGGDEFAVLLPGATGETAQLTAQRLVELLSRPVMLGKRALRLGASIGLAPACPGRGPDAVQRADIAMYAAKASGKNRALAFHPSLLQVEESAALEADLRAAVDNGELVVVYQPIVSAADGRCTAVEALVRWAHPTRGLLTPPQFLDAAERTGLIIPLGEHVLRTACADLRHWQDGGAPIAVHVNASPTQLGSPRFVPLVRECLDRYGLAPEQLVVEITESSALESPAARAAIDALSGMDVGIAVDDFGTGYSALTLLRTVPIDIVKIDKSFVAGAATEAADQAVLQAIVQLAENLGLQTVAEGVEDADQQRFVQGAGITAVQGYLHLRPVPADELTAWLGDPARRPTAVTPVA